ncbi:uncharacterized protein LOC141658886 [Silene latifolia]|uniref:uncharacterized protein LOC141658886 n=1 Tax=Silene latifolia TaxID=37657 RepID=UPI003D77F5CB
MTNNVVVDMTGISPDPDEFRMVSPAVNKEGKLPRWCTDDGQGAKRNISPPIEWYNIPKETKSLALVVQDIDAPDPSSPLVPWTIWVVADIPPTLKGLPEGFSGKNDKLSGEYEKVVEGNNDDKIPGWRVPMMPNPGHRIEFRLYALDDEVHLGRTVTKERLLDTIQGHVIGEAAFITLH